jgi:hypothetical protein
MIHECDNCYWLEKELAEALRQRDEARAAASTATDLMMKGESLRSKMMLEAILTDGFKKKD